MELRSQIAVIKQVKGAFDPITGTSIDTEQVNYLHALVISAYSRDINQESGITTINDYKIYMEYDPSIVLIPTDIIEYNFERYSILGKPRYLPNDVTPIAILFTIRKIV